MSAFHGGTLRTMRALALTLAAVAAVSACGGSSGGPRTAPPVSTSPAAVASPTAAAGVPTQAKAADTAGATAFAKFFYAQTVVAFSTNNPELIQAISAPGCTACKNYIDSLTRLRDNNERVENFEVNIIDAVTPTVTGPTARVDVSFSAPQAIRYDASGKVILRDGPYKRIDESVDLVRSGDAWLVKEIKALRRQA
jgi:thiol-disulfide isomerase/thioredoxin